MATGSSRRTGPRSTSAPDDRIRLWHPIDAAEADIAAWRAGLLARQVRQPFKQAFREVYVLTPAETETEPTRTGSPATSCAIRRPGP